MRTDFSYKFTTETGLFLFTGRIKVHEKIIIESLSIKLRVY